MSNWWNESYINRRSYIMERLEDIAVNGEEAMTIMLIDYFNEQKINIDHVTLAKKLKKNNDEIDELLSTLTTRGYLQVLYESGKIVFNIDGIFTSESKTKTAFDESLFNLFENEFGRPLTQKELECLSDWTSTYEQKLIIYALREAVIYNKKHFDYIERILSDWKTKKLSVEQIEKGER
ncbi:MAG: DnaD domain protein [Erysipelotrichaceae bacterium]